MTQIILNPTQLGREFKISNKTVQKWLDDREVEPVKTFRYAKGVSRLYDANNARTIIDGILNPKVDELPFVDQDISVPRGCGTQLDQLEDLVESLKVEVKQLQAQNRVMMAQLSSSMVGIREQVDKMIGVWVPNT